MSLSSKTTKWTNQNVIGLNQSEETDRSSQELDDLNNI